MLSLNLLPVETFPSSNHHNAQPFQVGTVHLAFARIRTHFHTCVVVFCFFHRIALVSTPTFRLSCQDIPCLISCRLPMSRHGGV